MKVDYKKNRTWSDRYIPAIKKIVGPLLLSESSFEEDTKEATDLVVLNAGGLKIACRTRRAGYSEKYGYEVTIRSRIDSGAKTELAKIREGFCDWMFYGHASQQDDGEFSRWMVINLDKLRAGMANNQVSWVNKSNPGDGTHFVAIDVRKIPADYVIDSSFDIIHIPPYKNVPCDEENWMDKKEWWHGPDQELPNPERPEWW